MTEKHTIEARWSGSMSGTDNLLELAGLPPRDRLRYAEVVAVQTFGEEGNCSHVYYTVRMGDKALLVLGGHYGYAQPVALRQSYDPLWRFTYDELVDLSVELQIFGDEPVRSEGSGLRLIIEAHYPAQEGGRQGDRGAP